MYLFWISGGLLYAIHETKDRVFQPERKRGFSGLFQGIIQDIKDQPVAASFGYLFTILIGGWAMPISELVVGDLYYGPEFRRSEQSSQ
jgi:hypothetical protein